MHGKVKKYTKFQNARAELLFTLRGNPLIQNKIMQRNWFIFWENLRQKISLDSYLAFSHFGVIHNKHVYFFFFGQAVFINTDDSF